MAISCGFISSYLALRVVVTGYYKQRLQEDGGILYSIDHYCLVLLAFCSVPRRLIGLQQLQQSSDLACIGSKRRNTCVLRAFSVQQ